MYVYIHRYIHICMHTHISITFFPVQGLEPGAGVPLEPPQLAVPPETTLRMTQARRAPFTLGRPRLTAGISAAPLR